MSTRKENEARKKRMEKRKKVSRARARFVRKHHLEKTWRLGKGGWYVVEEN